MNQRNNHFRGERPVGWGEIIFPRKAGWYWPMPCLLSKAQQLKYVHPINSVWTRCVVPKALLQTRLRIKTPSRPGDTFHLPICFLNLCQNSLAHKMVGKNTEYSGFTLLWECSWLEEKTRGNVLPTWLKPCGYLRIAASPLQRQKQEQELLSPLFAANRSWGTVLWVPQIWMPLAYT